MTDQGLGGEVSHGDRRAVVFGQGWGDHLGLHLFDQQGCLADGLECELNLGGVEVEHRFSFILSDSSIFL